MYRKMGRGWAKHLDFIILDMLCLQASYFTAYIIRYQVFFPLDNLLYRNMIFVFFFSQLFIIFFRDSFHHVLKRGYYQEFTASGKQACFVILFSTFYLFTTQEGSKYSRLTMGITFVLYWISTYITRCLWKLCLQRLRKGERGKSLVILTSAAMAGEIIHNLQKDNFQKYCMVGVALAGKEKKGWEDREGIGKVEGAPIVASLDTLVDYVCREWVDEVLISLPKEIPFPEKVYDELISMGVTVHLRLLRAVKLAGQKQSVEHLGSYTVLSSSINMISLKQAVCKRLIDIAGGAAGCLCTALLFMIIGPVIYIKSPGSIFFAQERVGLNGRRFKLYKFRSMYPDAEERKEELLKRNRVEGNLMFKMKDDPRIIGGEKGIGGMIRKYSIDEFPQFWNVLKGEMSLVGTRPPTVEEWEKYDLHHRVRLATKPGITGLWQVSGRSRITDFEEVVRLDKEYIMDWSMGLDLKILFKTVKVVLGGEGAL